MHIVVKEGVEPIEATKMKYGQYGEVVSSGTSSTVVSDILFCTPKGIVNMSRPHVRHDYDELKFARVRVFQPGTTLEIVL